MTAITDRNYRLSYCAIKWSTYAILGQEAVFAFGSLHILWPTRNSRVLFLCWLVKYRLGSPYFLSSQRWRHAVHVYTSSSYKVEREYKTFEDRQCNVIEWWFDHQSSREKDEKFNCTNITNIQISTAAAGTETYY